MSDLRPKATTITLGEKEYGLLFTLNAVDEIQDHLDIPISQLEGLLNNERTVYKTLRYLLTVLINEAIDDAETREPHVDERFVGRKINMANLNALQSGVYKSFTAGMPEPQADDEAEDKDPNLKSGQQIN